MHCRKGGSVACVCQEVAEMTALRSTTRRGLPDFFRKHAYDYTKWMVYWRGPFPRHQGLCPAPIHPEPDQPSGRGSWRVCELLQVLHQVSRGYGVVGGPSLVVKVDACIY